MASNIQNGKHGRSREDMIAQIQRGLSDVRAQLHPDLLLNVKNLIHKQSAQNDIKIDRARNVALVEAFLNTPEGAKFKDKI